MKFAYALLLALGMVSVAHADGPQTSALAPSVDVDFDTAGMSEADLQKMDVEYEKATGLSSHLPTGKSNGCERATCHIYAVVDKSKQTLELYVDGNLQYTWAVSTARRPYTTPNFDRHPDGRIYNAYMSTKYPGGDWNGLGNMPYVVFISGGIGIHGVPKSEWPELGHVASHGCIRINPNNAYIFNRMVRAAGIQDTWITVQD